MSKKKKIKSTKKQEEQANKVIKMIIAGFIILALIFMLGAAYF